MTTTTLPLHHKLSRSLPFGIKLVLLIIFLRTLGWGFVDPYFSIYLDQFSRNYTVVGLFVSIMSAVSLMTLIPLSRLADKVKDTQLMKNGEMIYFVVITLYYLAGVYKSLPILVAALILNGVAQQFLLVGVEAYIRRHNADESERSFGYYIAFDHFGWVMGMIASSYLIARLNINMMFLFVLPSAVIGYFILSHMHDRGLGSVAAGFRKYCHSVADFKNLFSHIHHLHPRTPFFLLLSFFDGIIRIFSFVFIPLFGISIGLKLPDIALLMGAVYFPFIFSFLFSEVSRRFNPMNVIASGLLIGTISFILLSQIVQEAWVVALTAMTSLSMAIIAPVYNGFLTRLTPRQMMGEITGLNNFVFRFGQIIGPIGIGFISDLYGIKTSFMTLAVVFLSLAVFSVILRSRDFTEPPHEL